MDDRYQLLDVQGEGSVGIVYRAFDQERGCDVAMKFLKQIRDEDRQQLAQEALLLRQLHHRFIVELLDDDVIAREPYLVFELCDRGSMRRWIGRLHWTVAMHALHQVAQGLARIHDIGGFHGDLKPENVLMKTDGHDPFIVKIADFGTACVPIVGSVMTHGPRGTRGYIAPEVIEGKRFTSAADIYSLGVMGTELLTGFREPSLLHRTDIPLALRRLVFAMRSRDPACRPTLSQIADVVANTGRIKNLPSSTAPVEIN